MRILIAEDDFTSRIVLTEVLKKNGHDVVVAVNGLEAWQAFQQPDAPRLAILDWMMPEISGVDVCRRVRTLQTDLPPYIIMLTSKGSKEDIVTGLESGADDYLSKPFVLEELRARVDVGQRMLTLQAAMSNKVQELTRWQSQMVYELKLAARLQTKLLATTPLLTTRHETRMMYHPCQHVGGDFFDALDLPDGRLCVYVGDVAGHGVGPSMIAALMKSVISDTVRVMADCGPAVVCREISNRFRDQVPDPDVYVTLFLAFHDPVTQQWRGINCGHPPPILFNRDRRDISASLGRTGCLPLGIEPTLSTGLIHSEQDEVSAPARPGDLLFLFTDGLLETRHREDGTLCGADKLRSALSNAFSDDATFDYPSCVLEQIVSLGYNLSSDDCCAISVRLTVPEELVLDSLIEPERESLETARAAVDQALTNSGWSDSSSEAACQLAMNYLSGVVEHDRVPSGTHIRLQVRLTGRTCRLLFFSEGREWDQSSRLADLRDRQDRVEAPYAQRTSNAISSASELYRRGSQNVAFFVIDPTGDTATA